MISNKILSHIWAVRYRMLMKMMWEEIEITKVHNFFKRVLKLVVIWFTSLSVSLTIQITPTGRLLLQAFLFYHNYFYSFSYNFYSILLFYKKSGINHLRLGSLKYSPWLYRMYMNVSMLVCVFMYAFKCTCDEGVYF